MNTYNQLITNYEVALKVKTKHGTKMAINIFRQVLRETIALNGELPYCKEIHALFIERANLKTGWGRKELIALLDDVVMEVVL
ncbi:hypothetical protein I6M39_03860 [Shewanella algae]|uniref:hypothetical protein n=1 Tax=Shewanella algae TaxID=38313 RepID=UPI001AACAD38|nr:hypothetical protein [Shewanella algae]MBO2568137.1 hypothetical protein [Shewanella algae]